MTNRFLISVAAAALIAGTGFANAQGAGGAQGGSTAQQHSAPSATGGAAPSRESGMTSGQSEKAAPAGKQAEDLKGGKAQQNTASDNDRMGKGGKDMKAEGREGKE